MGSLFLLEWGPETDVELDKPRQLGKPLGEQVRSGARERVSRQPQPREARRQRGGHVAQLIVRQVELRQAAATARAAERRGERRGVSDGVVRESERLQLEGGVNGEV